MRSFTAKFTHHAKLIPNEIDRVTFTIDDNKPIVNFIVMNRSQADYIYFDFTWPAGELPMMDITPLGKDTFCVMPMQYLSLDKVHYIEDFTVVSDGAADYSIMALY